MPHSTYRITHTAYLAQVGVVLALLLTEPGAGKGPPKAGFRAMLADEVGGFSMEFQWKSSFLVKKKLDFQLNSIENLFF